MNREQQYRTGRFPAVDPIPTWLREEVAQVSRDEQSYWRAYAKRRIGELLAHIEEHKQLSEQARAFLNWGGGQSNKGLLKHVEGLIAQDAEQEPLYWAAMWQLKKVNAMQEEYERWLPVYSDALELEAASREQGWPESWPVEFCKLWQRIGGTPHSAKAWDRAGWPVTEVLTRAELQSMGRLSLADRLVALRISARVAEYSEDDCIYCDEGPGLASTVSNVRSAG